MFLDESGDHNLTVIDPQYPVFVLGGIIVDQRYADGELDERIRRFKVDMFGHDDVILRTADISRIRGEFVRMLDPDFRLRFYLELNALMRSLDYQVVACVIRKDQHLARYGLAAIDPYLFSLDVLVERFCFEIGDVPDGGVILAEKRGQVLDRELAIAWQNLMVRGTRYVHATTIDRRIVALRTRDKQENIAGLQLADLVVSPIGRHILGKKSFEDWSIIETKFRRRKGTYLGAGLVVLPADKE
jgi:hypothetical protein